MESIVNFYIWQFPRLNTVLSHRTCNLLLPLKMCSRKVKVWNLNFMDGWCWLFLPFFYFFFIYIYLVSILYSNIMKWTSVVVDFLYYPGYDGTLGRQANGHMKSVVSLGTPDFVFPSAKLDYTQSVVSSYKNLRSHLNMPCLYLFASGFAVHVLRFSLKLHSGLLSIHLCWSIRWWGTRYLWTAGCCK